MPGARSPRHRARGVTPPARHTPHRGARAGRPATDFGAVRRSEEIIEMLASRRIPARLRTDPAVAVLSSLTSDIDGAVCAPGRAGPRHAAGRTRQHGARSGSARPRSAWPHAAAAAAVAAAIATLTAVAAATLMVVGMFARLSAARPRRPRY